MYYPDQAKENGRGFGTGDEISVKLTGRIEKLRRDSNGLKVCIRGDGFFVWFAVGGRDVEIVQN